MMMKVMESTLLIQDTPLQHPFGLRLCHQDFLALMEHVKKSIGQIRTDLLPEETMERGVE